jgi:hypothetical protein
MIATTEPRSCETQSKTPDYKRLAKAYGAEDVDNVVTYLRFCLTQADTDNTIRQLRHNQPQLFKKGR